MVLLIHRKMMRLSYPHHLELDRDLLRDWGRTSQRPTFDLLLRPVSILLLQLTSGILYGSSKAPRSRHQGRSNGLNLALQSTEGLSSSHPWARTEGKLLSCFVFVLFFLPCPRWKLLQGQRKSGLKIQIFCQGSEHSAAPHPVPAASPLSCFLSGLGPSII